MIKKYFALSIIALSVAIAGCSSDDDDDDGGVTDVGGETVGGETDGGDTAGGETAGGETAGGETAGGETDGGEPAALADPIPGSGLAAVVASEDHAELVAAVSANPDIYNALNAADGTFTIFAPTAAAFTEYEALVTASTTDDTDDAIEDLATFSALSEATVSRILLGHVGPTQIGTPFEDGTSFTTLAEADTEAGLDAQVLTLNVDGNGASSVTAFGSTAPVAAAESVLGEEEGVLPADQDSLISIDSLLTPSDVDLTVAGNTEAGGETAGGETAGGETAGGETDGGETAGGEPSGDHVGAGNTVADAFAAQLSAQYTGTSADDGSTNTTDLWAFFVPDDSVTDGTTIDFAFLQSHVDTDTGSTRTFDLAGFPDGGSILVNGQQTYQITNDGTTITVGGATITQLGTTPQGGFIYAADAILVP